MGRIGLGDKSGFVFFVVVVVVVVAFKTGLSCVDLALLELTL